MPQMAQKAVFGPFSLFLGYLFNILSVRPNSIFRRFFFYFGPEARNRPSPIYIYICVGGTFRVYVAILASGKIRRRSAKWYSQIRNALFPRNFAGTNCKYCKNKDFVGL